MDKYGGKQLTVYLIDTCYCLVININDVVQVDININYLYI